MKRSLCPFLSLYNQQSIHNSKIPPPSTPENAAHLTVKVGGLEPTEEGEPGKPRAWFLRSWPLARAAEPREPGSRGRRGPRGSSLRRQQHLQPQVTRECRQWRPPQTSQHRTQQRCPSPFQALLHPHTPTAAAEPENQGTSGMAKGARHADAPGQDTRDTGSLALKTTEAQEATTGAQATDSEKGYGQQRARILTT